MDFDKLGKVLLKLINNYNLPLRIEKIFTFLHGPINIEIIFFLFCVVSLLLILRSPKKGPKVTLMTSILIIATYFSAQSLRNLFPVLGTHLNPVLKTSSAFPVLSILIFSNIIVPIHFYFPNIVGLRLLYLAYATVPIYLDLVYPSDAFGSLILGYLLSYFMVWCLSKITYFSKY